MAIVRDLSGNNPYIDTHIAEPSGTVSVDTTGLATEDKQDDIILELQSLTLDTTGLATEATLEAIRLLAVDIDTNTDGLESGFTTANAHLSAIETAAEDTAPVVVTLSGAEMEPVAASATDQMLGATGAAGDILEGLWIIPATTSPGAVSVEDGATNYPVFAGGTDSVSNLVPFYFPFGVTSLSGGWEVTTGANVSVIAVGRFT